MSVTVAVTVPSGAHEADDEEEKARALADASKSAARAGRKGDARRGAMRQG